MPTTLTMTWLTELDFTQKVGLCRCFYWLSLFQCCMVCNIPRAPLHSRPPHFIM